MLRLDSTKIKFSTSHIKRLDDAYFKNDVSYYANDVATDKLRSVMPLAFGIKNCEVDKIGNSVIMEFSAKALQKHYAQGINKETIFDLFQNINDKGGMLLNIENVVNDAIVLRTDVTDNVIIDDANIYKKLFNIPLATKYHKDYYSTASGNSVVIRGNQKTFKERQIVYDKAKELLSAKNKDIVEYMGGRYNVGKQFNNVARVESNIAQARVLKHYTGTPTRLMDVLSTDAKVNYELFKKITKQTDVDILELFSKYEGQSFNEIEKTEGRIAIVKQCKTWHNVEQFLKTYNGNNRHKKIKDKYLQVFNEIHQNTKGNQNIIKFFLEQLRNVA